MRILLFVCFCLLVLAAAVGYAFWGTISLYLVEDSVEQAMLEDRLGTFDDGLHVALCGSGASLDDPERSGPCVAVIVGRQIFLVDTGSGSAGTLARMRLPIGDVRAVLLTHFHSDHINGLGEVMAKRWLASNALAPLPIHGPKGVEEVVTGFNIAYAPNARHRMMHHGKEIAPESGAGGTALPFNMPRETEYVVVHAAGGLQISAFKVDHAPTEAAVGYRFDYKGRALVISGDTRKSANVQQFARSADLLVHEAFSPRLMAPYTAAARSAGKHALVRTIKDMVEQHTTPIEAAEIARDAGVKHLLFYHILPPAPLGTNERLFAEGVSTTYSGGFTVGRDGTLISLPAGSNEVRVGSLF